MFEKLSGRKPELIDFDLLNRYAVVAPYLPDEDAFLFEVRSEKLRNQPGEISFPGGKIEAGESPEQAAIRETTEELLMTSDNIHIIAPLDIYLAPYHRMVYPYLGELKNYSGTFQTDEVTEVFTVPFSFFLETPPKIYTNEITMKPRDADFPYDLLGTDHYPWGKSAYPIYFYVYKNRTIWGMTARFINNIVNLWRASL